jgi:hypothetical protein
MSDEAPDMPGKLFIAEFLDKELVAYDECSKHYESMTLDQLMDEMKFLFEPATRAIPFGFTGRRYYAFSTAFVDCIANLRGLPDRERSQLTDMAITLFQYNRNRTAESSREALAKAQAATLDGITTYALYPKVGELIASETTGYDGVFEEGVVGQILEKE